MDDVFKFQHLARRKSDVSDTPRGEGAGNKYCMRWRLWGCRVNKGNEEGELTDTLYAPWHQDEIQEMKVTCMKDTSITCTINGIMGQGKKRPLEYAMKLSGSLKKPFNSLGCGTKLHTVLRGVDAQSNIHG